MTFEPLSKSSEVEQETDPAALLSLALASEAVNETVNPGGSGHYRASEAGGCLRKIWYRISGYRPWPDDTTGGLILLAGNVIHDVVRQLMISHGIDIGQVTLREDYTIEEQGSVQKDVAQDGEPATIVSCRPDGIQDNGTALLEIKTIGQWGFRKLQDVWNVGGNKAAVAYVKERYPGYYAQTNVTAALCGAKRIFLLPVCRDNWAVGLDGRDSKRRSISYPFDGKEYDVQRNRFVRVEKARISGEAPRAEFADGSYDCKYCRFHYLCHGASKKRQHPADAYAGAGSE